MKKKSVAVFSAGGALSAWTSGAYLKLHQEGKLPEFDLYSGVSSGLLNAAKLAQTANPSLLYRLWRSIDNLNVRKWTWLYHLNLLIRGYLYDSSPLKDLIHREVNPSKLSISPKELLGGYVDALTGNYIEFDKTDSELCDKILASCSAPGIFPPVPIGDTLGQDGGIHKLAPLGSAIAAGATEVYMFLTHPLDRQETADPSKVSRGLGYLSQTLHNIFQGIWERDLTKCHTINREVSEGRSDKKYVNVYLCYPDRPLDYPAFDFSNSNLKALSRMGYDTAKVVKLSDVM